MMHPEFINKIDWELLREQKIYLLKRITSQSLTFEECGYLDGLVNLIDEIQDYAVDEMGIDENIVFEKEEENE